MEIDYLIINREKYRLEFNWNAISEFVDEEGIPLKEADQVDKLKAKQITHLIYCGAKEGARLQGKEFNYSILDIGASLNTNLIRDAMLVFHRQISTGEEAKKKMGKQLFQRKK